MSDDTALFNGNEQWNPYLEKLVKKEGEQSQALYWLHNESSKLATMYNDWIQIPGIILASITGFLSATSNIVPPIGIGAMSLIVGLLNTIISYYKFPQNAEAHKISAQLYLKMYKNIRTELSLPIKQRANANDLLQNIRDKLARITEIAPQIPNRVIKRFKRKFKLAQISKPIVANGLDPIEICVSSVDSFHLKTPKNIATPYYEIGLEQTDDLTVVTTDLSPKNTVVDLSSNSVKSSNVVLKSSSFKYPSALVTGPNAK
jgi:hypothetical protein